MGGNINFGSRTEFLPGENSPEIDIKYQRYGGCFVTYKKGVLYFLVSVLFAAIVGYLVFYYFACKTRNPNELGYTDSVISEILEAAKQVQETPEQITKSKISNNVIPLFYRLKIQPYLNETKESAFSFEGHVSIVFQINGSPTKTIILNAQNLSIEKGDVSLTYTSTSQVQNLRADNLVLEDDNNTSTTTENDTDSETTVSTPIQPDNDTNDLESSFSDIVTTFPPNEEPIKKASTTQEEKEETTSTVKQITPTVSTEEPEEPEPVSIPPTKSSSPRPTSTTSTESSVIKIGETTNIIISKQSFHETDETFILKTQPLEENINYTLTIKFRGSISDKPGGLFRSSYRQNNDTMWLVTTIMKPKYARRVFPCFDEPHLKSNFEISVARSTNMKVVSNMPIKETHTAKNEIGLVWDHFEMTPPMSTHSVGFAILNFDSTKSSASVPLPLTKLWGRSETISKSDYILDIAPKIIDSFNHFFGYNYSLHKLDLVAVPNLPFSVVSSWGMLFIREDEVLVSKSSSYKQKENLLEFLTRELAKQWLGHVVSMQSWTDLWLMESIASYCHYIAMSKVDPSWNSLDEIPIIDTQNVLHSDILKILPVVKKISAHPGNDEIQQILYKKGGLIMRNLNLTLPNNQFKYSLQDFIQKNKYKTSSLLTFWQSFVNVSLNASVSIKDFMNRWTTQEGYPIVSVTLNYEDNSVVVNQYHLLNGRASDKNSWILPLTYKLSTNDTNQIEWITDAKPKVLKNIVADQNNTWILFNTNGASLCRINYDLNNWNSLISALKSKPDNMSPTNRAQLLDDAFHLAQYGFLNYSIALDLSLYLPENERDFLPWNTAMENIRTLDVIFSKTSSYDIFQEYVIKLLKPMYSKISKNLNKFENYSEASLAKLIFSWLCKFNYKPCNDWAYEQFEKYVTSKNLNDGDLKSIVYCTGVQMRGRNAWDILWKKYSEMKNKPDDIQDLITGMSCATEPWLITKYLQRSLEEENIYYSVQMWNQLSSATAVETGLIFLKDNWEEINNKYKDSSYALKQIISGISSKLSTKYDLEQLVYFYNTDKIEITEIAKGVKQLKDKLNWKEKYLEKFIVWIKNNVL